MQHIHIEMGQVQGICQGFLSVLATYWPQHKLNASGSSPMPGSNARFSH